MHPDPLEPIVKIGERLREKAAEIGLEVQAFAVMPDFSGGTSHALQVVFTLTEDAVIPPAVDELAPLPATEWDDDLAGILAATAEVETETEVAEAEALREVARAKEKEKADEAIQTMLANRARLQKPGGLFGDDDA